MEAITETQQFTYHFKPENRLGGPATVDGIPAWVSSDPSVATVTPAADGLSAVVKASPNKVGTVAVSVAADADLGVGIQPLTAVGTVVVNPAPASVLALTMVNLQEQVITPPGNPITSTLVLSATFQSIGVEWPITAGYVGVPALTYRKVGSGPWLPTLPLWRTSDRCYGKVKFCDPDQAYEVRVSHADNTTETSTFTTRADNIPTAASLTPTHFLSPLGSDGAAGTSPVNAWKTIEKAMNAAPAGAVVEMFAGGYTQSYAFRNTPITFVGTNPPVVAAPYPIAQRAQVEMVQTADRSLWSIVRPAAAIPAASGAWTSVNLTGPKTGQSFQIWKATPAFLTGAVDCTGLGYSLTALGPPQRSGLWDRKGADMSTPAGWLEILRTNLTYNFGWARFGTDIYLRMQGDADPNGYFWTPAGLKYSSSDAGFGFTFNGPDCNVYNVALYGCGIARYASARRGVDDHCLFVLASDTGSGQAPNLYGTDPTVQYARFEDSNLWSADGTGIIPWVFIKDVIKMPADATHPAIWDYPFNRLGAWSESGAIGGIGGAQRATYRYCTIDGPFNGFTWYNPGYDRYSNYLTDIHDCIIRHVSDDGLEPEQQAINLHCWDSRFEQTMTVLSTGPLSYGPVYLDRIEGWRIGGISPVGFKYSGTSFPRAKVYANHLTFWTDLPGVSGGDQFAGGGTNTEMFEFKNCLIRMSRYCWKSQQADILTEDYNHWVTTDPLSGMRIGLKYKANVAQYRTDTHQGAHSNTRGDFVTPAVLDNALVNPAAGDLRVKPGDLFLAAGIAVPNLIDTLASVPMGAY